MSDWDDFKFDSLGEAIGLLKAQEKDLDKALAKTRRQAIAISAAIDKLEGPGMSYKAREAIHILTEVQDED